MYRHHRIYGTAAQVCGARSGNIYGILNSRHDHEPTKWAVVVKIGARARLLVDFGRKRKMPQFRGSRPVRNISPRRPMSSARSISRLSPHLESTLSTLPVSDQTLCWVRGGADKYCVTDPGTTVGVNTGVNTYTTGPIECLIGHGERGKCAL